MKNISDAKIAVIGLGYVGLPLAVEFGRKRNVIGFDIDTDRVQELKNGYDRTLEIEGDSLKEIDNLIFSSNVDDLLVSDIYIVTVPTPIDKENKPDLSPLIKASEMLGRVLSKGNIVIYESTVYPGATEDDCVPILERNSGLTFNQDFFAGYSPERINPGDKINRLPNIMKVTSGSTPEIANIVDALYREIITAGTHKAPSIKVAEGAKIIENIQRDVNIALVNELYQIFDKMGVDTNQVIEAASTKWNFMKLKPGLVGGHCISVDPYYLLHKSQSCGYIPDLMRRAREINNGMADYVANSFLKKLVKNSINPVNLSVLILGFSFKADCPDIRNTKVFELYNSLVDLGFNVDVYDPVIDIAEAKSEYGLDILNTLDISYDAGILAVEHESILHDLLNGSLSFKEDYIYDFKGLLNVE